MSARLRQPALVRTVLVTALLAASTAVTAQPARAAVETSAPPPPGVSSTVYLDVP